jgi:hypothetical protein
MKTNNLAEECLKNLKTKKISLNLDVDTLEFIDELSKLTNVTRTTTIMSIIGSGMKEIVISLETSLKKTQKQSPKPEKIEELLKELKKFKQKWHIDDWPV